MEVVLIYLIYKIMDTNVRVVTPDSREKSFLLI